MDSAYNLPAELILKDFDEKVLEVDISRFDKRYNLIVETWNSAEKRRNNIWVSSFFIIIYQKENFDNSQSITMCAENNKSPLWLRVKDYKIKDDILKLTVIANPQKNTSQVIEMRL